MKSLLASPTASDCVNDFENREIPVRCPGAPANQIENRVRLSEPVLGILVSL